VIFVPIIPDQIIKIDQNELLMYDNVIHEHRNGKNSVSSHTESIQFPIGESITVVWRYFGTRAIWKRSGQFLPVTKRRPVASS
jgi:hypothetical protein